MGMIVVDPNVEPQQGGFAPVKAGIYPMRIATHEERVSKAGDPYISWRFEHVTPADQLLGLSGEKLQGNSAGVFYATRSDAAKQGMLRHLVTLVLGEWRNFDPEELYSKELSVSLKVETYEGNQRNAVGSIAAA